MDYKVINLKENLPSVEEALFKLTFEIEIAKLEGVKAIKFIHGYGSNGVGGAICHAVRNRVPSLKKQKIIKDYLLGEEWSISNPKCFKLLTSLSDCYNDEDLGHLNPGITIVFIRQN